MTDFTPARCRVEYSRVEAAVRGDERQLASATTTEIDDLSDVTTYGDTVPTTTDYGTESLRPTKVTATNPAGRAQVSVTYNSVTKPLTTTAPVV